MEIPVLLEPSATGYRASTQSPVSLSADGLTESAAIAALTTAIEARLQNGGKLITLTMPVTETMRDITARMRRNPLFAEYEAEIRKYHQAMNAIPDAD